MDSVSLESAISIGIELETIYEVDTELCPYHSLIGFDVDKVLEQARDVLEPIKGELAGRGEIPPYGVVVHYQSEYSDEGIHKRRVQDNFVIRTDPSIKLPDNGRGKYYGVEISTPAFTNGAWQTAIPVMMERLRRSGRFQFNYSTALHVHIGKGLDEKFSLEELSRVAKAIILFESQMSTLHPERDPSSEYGRQYYKLINQNPRLKALSTKERIELIECISKEGSADKLKHYMNYSTNPKAPELNSQDFGSGCQGESWLTGKIVEDRAPNDDEDLMSEKYYTYNLESNDKYGTIEFRQAAASLVGACTLEWIDIVIRFVVQACQTDQKKFLELAEFIMRDDFDAFGIPFRLREYTCVAIPY